MTGLSSTGNLGDGARGAAERLAQLRIGADETAALGSPNAVLRPAR